MAAHEKSNRIQTKKYQNHLTHYVMMSPFLLLFTVFTIIPVLAAIALSFTDFNMLQLPGFAGAGNYIRLLFEDDVFMISLKNTLILALVTGPIGYILSFAVAWLINEFGRRIRTMLTFFIYLPVLCGNVFMIWQYIFASDSRGFANDLLLKLGIISEPLGWLTDPSYNLTIVAVVTIWMSFGAGFLAFVSGLQSLDRTYFEAAAIDGLKNRWQELYYVTFPQMKEFLLFGAVMSISGAFSVGAVNQALTGFPSTNYSTHTMVLYISDYSQTRFEMGYASAGAVTLFALMLFSWRLINKLLRKISI